MQGHLTKDRAVIVRVAYAENIAQLAETALRWVRVRLCYTLRWVRVRLCYTLRWVRVRLCYTLRWVKINYLLPTKRGTIGCGHHNSMLALYV